MRYWSSAALAGKDELEVLVTESERNGDTKEERDDKIKALLNRVLSKDKMDQEAEMINVQNIAMKKMAMEMGPDSDDREEYNRVAQAAKRIMDWLERLDRPIDHGDPNELLPRHF